ncbi:hypothetical protein [uncultured Reyranella sp.]|uniref:hypothetical protein n=1 Tax=uncultured Reyranella sp. TaxID=735512 RepID=UPI0025F3DA2A|nr:hypothetical protein [uncultured Reyranella sp.]
MKLARSTALAASAATLGSSLAVPAVKASPCWPAGPTKLIAAFPPGGTADTISRIPASKLSAELGTQVVERVKEVLLLPGNKPMAPAEYTAFVSEFATLGAGVSKSAGIELELG